MLCLHVFSRQSLFVFYGETPMHTGRFLSTDEHRQQNTEAQRAKRMKMSPSSDMCLQEIPRCYSDISISQDRYCGKDRES